MRKKARPYQSPLREVQASETKERISVAARALFVERGYAATTIDAVAKSAGVSAQTVYAAFGTKQGILLGIMDRARFGDAYQRLLAEVKQTDKPADRLRIAARIACQIFRSEREELDVFRGAGVVSPELAMMDEAKERHRYDAQSQMITFLSAKRALEVSAQSARDILWALTTRELYRLLVLQRGWSAEKYEKWLGDLLVEQLLKSNLRS